MNRPAMPEDAILREQSEREQRVVNEAERIVRCDKCRQPATMRIRCDALRIASFACDTCGAPLIDDLQRDNLTFAVVRVVATEPGWLREPWTIAGGERE